MGAQPQRTGRFRSRMRERGHRLCESPDVQIGMTATGGFGVDSSHIIDLVLSEDRLVLLIGGTLGLVGIVFGTVSSMVKATAKERTRREIAAYIAEDSMTPEQGERILMAGRDRA